MEYKAKKDYSKTEGLAQFGAYGKHKRLLSGDSVEITILPDGWDKYVEPVKAKKSEGDK